jgi:hypothetical protein
VKELKDWTRELDRAVAAAEREVCAQNEAFKETLAEWGTAEESAAFAEAMAFTPGSEKKRAMLVSAAMRG